MVRLDDEETVAISNGKVTELPTWIEEERYFIRMEKESAESNVVYELVFTEQSVKGTFVRLDQERKTTQRLVEQ